MGGGGGGGADEAAEASRPIGPCNRPSGGDDCFEGEGGCKSSDGEGDNYERDDGHEQGCNDLHEGSGVDSGDAHGHGRLEHKKEEGDE